jgi:hypothetical protein
MQRSAPIIVVGSPRSGTTLVRRLLCAHPRLYVPGETGYDPFLRTDPHAPLSPRRASRVLRRIALLNRHWTHGDDALSGLDPEPRLRDVLDALYAQRAHRYGAERWGDKTPGYVRYLPTLERIFPGALVIHVLRDGRDVALSARAEWGANHWYMDLHYLLRQWELNVRTGRRDGSRMGEGRYLELRYEELAAAPQEAMARVLRFLGEAPDPAVEAAIDSSAAVPGERFHRGVHRPVSTASVERWRRQLSPREAKLADSLVGDLLAELGYPASGLGGPTLGERLAGIPAVARYAVAAPLRRLLYAVGVLTLNRGLRSRWHPFRDS